LYEAHQRAAPGHRAASRKAENSGLHLASESAEAWLVRVWFRRSSVAALFAVITLAGCVPASSPPATGARPDTGARAPRPAVTAVHGANVGVSLYGSVLAWTKQDLVRDLDRVQRMGATWVRVPFNWVTLEMHGKNQWNWGLADTIVAETAKRGLRILGVVSYTPAWARPAGRPATDPPTNLDEYARFMKVIAQRYGPFGVKHWEIWNEPNLTSMWTPLPDAAKYTALLKKAYTAVKQADPNAVVVTAGLSPAWDAPDGTQIAPVTFVERMYAAGAKGSFDALAHHPSTYPWRSSVVAPWNSFTQTKEMNALMRAHGDGKKKIWATEIGFPTGRSPRAITEQTQAKYLVESLRAWTDYSFDGPVFVYSMRDEGPDRADHYQNFGLVRTDGTPKPAYLALQRTLRR
jgi:hypothetical protein